MLNISASDRTWWGAKWKSNTKINRYNSNQFNWVLKCSNKKWHSNTLGSSCFDIVPLLLPNIRFITLSVPNITNSVDFIEIQFELEYNSLYLRNAKNQPKIILFDSIQRHNMNCKVRKDRPYTRLILRLTNDLWTRLKIRYIITKSRQEYQLQDGMTEGMKKAEHNSVTIPKSIIKKE